MKNVPFPLSKISKEDRDTDYQKLRDLKFKSSDKLTLSHIGNKTSNHYFQSYRVKTKTGKWSQYDRWKNDPEKIKRIDMKIHRKNPDIIGTNKGLQYALEMSGSSVNQFKPYIAVYVYQKFKPKRILDISAGWGDRLIGAMSQDIDYIGIDSNKKLKTPYNRMIKDYQGKSNSNIMMLFNKSEKIDYSKLPYYDLIFTSPPYFSLEKYEGMTEYKDNNDFKDSYFIPTIKNSWKYLKKGGVMALNMPEEMYKILIPLLGKASKIPMPIQNRFAYKKDGAKKHENIYWWRK